LNSLTYVSCVINETLRRWPAANGTGRKVNTDDFKIKDLDIPRGAILHVYKHLEFKFLFYKRYDFFYLFRLHRI
jgi:hypothetical protein